MHADAPTELTLDRSLGIDTSRGLHTFADDVARYRAALARFADTYREGLPDAARSGAWQPTAEALRTAADRCAAIGATALSIEAARIERSLYEYDPPGRAVEAERYGRLVARLAAGLEQGGASDAAAAPAAESTTLAGARPIAT